MGAEGAVIQLVTRCASAEEFVERFARFTTGTDVVVPALPHLSVGTAGQFVISLKDRSVMMKGRCEVTEIRSADVAPGAPPGPAGPPLMRLRLLEMDAHSRGVHLRLMERHASSAKPPAPTPPPVQRTRTRTLSLVPPTQTMTIPRPPPLRPVPAPVPVGASTAPGAAGMVVAVAPPLETDRTEVSPARPPETRVPGAAFTLPANPLGDLDAADLASFVELTLLENDAVAAAPLAVGETVDEAVNVGADVGDDRPAAGPPAPAACAQDRLDRARRIARRVAPYASCLLVGLVLGLVLKPGAKVAPVVVTPAVVAAAVVAPPTVAPPPPAPAPADDDRAGRPRDCQARVTTTPAGTAVFWGDIALGTSPIEHAAVPCGAARVTFRRERYAEVTRTITTERGQSAQVDQRLRRPPARLIVTSSPPNALVKLNKQRFGTTPREISTQRFEHVRVEVSLPGHERWKKTLYLKEGESRIDVKLARVPEPRGRRTPPPPAPPARPTPPPSSGAVRAR